MNSDDLYMGSVKSIGELIPGVLEAGDRHMEGTERPIESTRKVGSKSQKRLYPTNSERMNRALSELSCSAFKIHTLLWQWRGAPARGCLPFFTVHGLCKFCSLTRPTIRAGVKELVGKGWIQKQGYNKHHKNELYSLVPIRDVVKVD